MTRRPWYQDSEPEEKSEVPTDKIDAARLEDRYIKDKGRYPVWTIKDDYPVEGLGTIPAGTRGIVTWPAGATSTRYVDFHFPRDVIMNAFKKNNRMTLPILLFTHVGYIDEL